MCLVISSGITDDDLRESAYEILLAATGASGYLLSPFCFVALSYYSWACVSKFPTLTNIDVRCLIQCCVSSVEYVGGRTCESPSCGIWRIWSQSK